MPTKTKPVKWSDIEREAWKLPEQLTVSQWADKNRVLDSKTSAEPGAWHTSRTPYLREIMDAFNDPFVEEITLMKATQIGGTEAIYNILGYIIDQDPAPTLLVMPRDTDSKSVSANRIQPMLNLSPALSSHLPRLSDDITKLEYHLDRMIVYFAGSNSPAGLAQRPIRYLFLDETDKYPKFSGKEADPIKLATERTQTFWNRKIIKVSTPTTRDGYIYREYQKSDKRQYFVPCPYCGKYQILVWSQVKWPEDERDSEKIKHNRLAWYECKYCKEKIKEEQKQRMMINGIWAQEDAEITIEGKIKNPLPPNSHRGFWLSALYSPWRTWSDAAAEFLNSKDYIELLMNFINSWLAEIWEEKVEESKPERIALLASNYDEGFIPAGVLVLTAGVDVQKGHFYMLIDGWGYGEESWRIYTCRIESWEEVISKLFLTSYKYQSGEKTLKVRLACFDSAYRTDEVYEVCRKWRDVARPTKGHDYLTGGMSYKGSLLDRWPNGQSVPAEKGGLVLWHLDTSHYKNKIMRMVHSEPGDPAQWHLPKNPSVEYLNQFCAEHKIFIINKKTKRTKEVWKLVTAGIPNHYLDCEVLATAAADMLHISALRKPGEETTYKPPQERQKKTYTINPSGSNWVRRDGKKWMR